MKLVAVKVNGEALPESDYQLTAKKLVLGGLPDGEFTLEIETSIKPQVRRHQAQLMLSHGFATSLVNEEHKNIAAEIKTTL